MLVGAAAEQPRKTPMASKSFFRGHRGGDTGEMEPVPGETADVDPEALRYAPRPPRRFGWFRRILALVVLLAVIAAAGLFAYNWSQKQYYVAVADEKVAIFRGIQSDLPGVTLHSVAEHTDVTVQALPEFNLDQVRSGIPAESLDHARDIVSELTVLARKCPVPEPTPSEDPTNKKRDGKKRDSSPSPSPSPTPTIEPPDCLPDASAATSSTSPSPSPEASPGAEPTP
jgi:protein phosphatase